MQLKTNLKKIKEKSPHFGQGYEIKDAFSDNFSLIQIRKVFLQAWKSLRIMDNGSKFRQVQPMQWTIDVSELALVSESGIGQKQSKTKSKRIIRNTK